MELQSNNPLHQVDHRLKYHKKSVNQTKLKEIFVHWINPPTLKTSTSFWIVLPLEMIQVLVKMSVYQIIQACRSEIYYSYQTIYI